MIEKTLQSPNISEAEEKVPPLVMDSDLGIVVGLVTHDLVEATRLVSNLAQENGLQVQLVVREALEREIDPSSVEMEHSAYQLTQDN